MFAIGNLLKQEVNLYEEFCVYILSAMTYNLQFLIATFLFILLKISSFFFSAYFCALFDCFFDCLNMFLLSSNIF